MTTLYASCWVVTCDDAGAEYESGWLLVDEGVISAVGGGAEPEADEHIDLGGSVVTPGLVNTHHHLYQTLTRARAQQQNLFGWLRELGDVKLSNEEISGFLGRMLFSGEERMKPTTTLSGGERVRLMLASLMLKKDNVLVLDEPTNHLDLEAISALAEGLERYEGTVIVVTHDQGRLTPATRRIPRQKIGLRDYRICRVRRGREHE